jgi:glyceraldehyde-3-phosphate dehydrogenase (NAD(P))
MTVKFDGSPPTKDEMLDLYKKESRVAILKNASSSAQIIEVVRDLGLKRNDVFLALLLANTIQTDGNEIFFSFFVPQESIVAPENLDAIVAQSNLMSKEESMRTTDNIFDIDKIKSNLETIFA